MNINLGGGVVLETGNIWQFIGGLMFVGGILFLLFSIVYIFLLHGRRVSESESGYLEYLEKPRSAIQEEIQREKIRISIQEAKANARRRTQEQAYQKLLERERENAYLDVYYRVIKNKLNDFGDGGRRE